MLKRLRLVLAAGVVAALAVSPAALASAKKNPKHGGGCVSAVCVYVEPHQSGAGGLGDTTQAIPAGLAAKLARYHGADKNALLALAALGTDRLQAGSGVGSAGSPSTLGAIFGVGFGPTALFALLLATALFLAGRDGVRRLRTR